jgi:branched-chain amino acid transport system permease protein
MALFQTIIPPVLDKLGRSTEWLYSTIFGGLTIAGAIIVFVVATALAAIWMSRGPEVRKRIQTMPKEGRRGLAGMALVVGAIALIALPNMIGDNLTQVLGTVGIYVLLGLGLNIVVGYAGLLDLGYVAFFAVGAYATALLTGAQVVTSLGATTSPAFSAHLNFYMAIPVVVLIAAFVGLLIGAPVLRLRGDYLAIVTLGFGEIARVLVSSDWLRRLLGGAQGLRDVTAAPIAGQSFRNPQPFYYLVLVFVLLIVFVSWRLANSRIGRAWNAMREDEQVAEAMGVSTVKYKLLAFATGAGVGSLSGALFAVKIGSLAPTSFTILVSITVLAVVILGGLGSVPGVVVGALVLIGLPGFLTEFEEYQLLLYGAALVTIMLLRPQGLIPNVKRMRELQEDERTQDTWVKAGETGAAATVQVGAGEAIPEPIE